MSITHLRLVRTEGQCPPRRAHQRSNCYLIGRFAFVQGPRCWNRRLSFSSKRPTPEGRPRSIGKTLRKKNVSPRPRPAGPPPFFARRPPSSLFFEIWIESRFGAGEAWIR
ncbi:hypothetical protein ZeamMp058 (mitochondrion) [Zea mays subsp. mays]|uniref:Uncharacterized protein orf109-a n=1 Tax=Zea mays TaxID=4577 RepID=Q6R9I7_MAIZE|nr:hypothetical protein ZeamMp058 [Zea mays subsp. mays]AAR91154.1 hypothetical protein [Zea mays]|eukprot:YP_588321.1 hypothetical protein ZeamMp058 (mitochondrion) [Zea mays subsp. mays]